MQIENSVKRVGIRRLFECRTVIPSDRIFSSHGMTVLDFFVAFSSFDNCIKLEYALLCQFYAKTATFSIKKCLVRFLSITLTSKCLVENDVKY